MRFKVLEVCNAEAGDCGLEKTIHDWIRISLRTFFGFDRFSEEGHVVIEYIYKTGADP